MSAAGSKKVDKTNIEDILALTPTQAGMLYHYIGGQEDGSYFQQLSLRLSGEISMQSLRQAWEFVVDTNETLRTVFRWEKVEHPVQVVLKKIEVPILERDFSSYPAHEQEQLIREAREEDRHTPIDLESQTFRIMVCKLDDKQAEMIVSWHHIVYDGWSNGIVLKEFMAAYDAFDAGLQPDKPRKTKFKEFIKWHQSRDSSKQQAYWSGCLQDIEERTALPLDAGSRTGPGQAASHIRAFSDSETLAISKYCRHHELTPASLLYGAWAILLQKYNRSRDVLFGTTVSGRVPDITQVDEMVGLFINTIPLRVKSPEGETVRELIRAVDQTLKARERFENMPLVDIAQMSGIREGGDLFDSIVVLENYPLDDRVRNGRNLRVDGYCMYEKTHYALTLGIKAFGAWELDLAYDTGSFSPDTIERMADHYMLIVRQMTERPEIEVSKLDIVTERERNRIVGEFNRPVGKHEVGLVHQAFEQQARRTPDHTAVICGESRYSYKEINEQANLLARRLRETSIAADCLVAILVERSASFIIAMLGVLKAGGAYIPIDPSYAAERIAYILRDSAAEFLVTKQALADEIGFAGTVMRMDDEHADCGDRADLDNINVPENLAYIIYTSGSTGEPKGVMTEHRNLLTYVHSFQNEFRLTASDVVLQQASCSFDHFVEEVYPALLGGGAIVIVNKMEVLDIDRLIQLIETHRISVVTVQPLLLNELNKRDGMASVHTFISGGDVFKFEHFSRLAQKASVYNSYGPTEATVCATYYRCGREKMISIPIGAPIADYNVYILDEGNRLMPVGIPGEICIAGNGIARGYLHNPGLTEQKFVDNPFHPGTTMYRTGDIGVWLSDGNIRFIGRNDEQVKIRGYRIDPREIENALLSHAAVEEAIVLPVDDANGSKTLAAFIRTQEQVGAEQLREHAAGLIPRYMLPSHYYKIDAVPRTGNDKADKKALLLRAERLDGGGDREEAESETEHKIASVWKQILKLDHVGLNDNFFDIGGNSILLMQMHARLQKDYGWGTAIADLFAKSTIFKLAQWIDTMEQSDTDVQLIGYQALPPDYFDDQPHAGGTGLLRFHLKNGLPESLGQIARDNKIELVDVLLSMLGYVFTEINDSKTAILHCLMENGEDIVPVLIDLTAVRGFEDLFRAVYARRNQLDTGETYLLEQLIRSTADKGTDQILPLVYKDTELPADARILEMCDLALGIEETEDGKQLSFTCKFNDRRLNKNKINLLIRSYIQLLTQLTQSRVYS
jgi:amino acid adenylation domain-containing protein